MDTEGEGEDFIEEDEVLMENAVHCPGCDEFTGHLILNEKPKGTGICLLYTSPSPRDA